MRPRAAYATEVAVSGALETAVVNSFERFARSARKWSVQRSDI